MNKYVIENLKTKIKYGDTVAHFLARLKILEREFMNEEILKLRNDNGSTVAHQLAEKSNLPKELMTEEILKLSSDDGWSVAHSLAKNFYLPVELMTEKILKLKNNNGSSVAHELAKNFYLPVELITDEILKLKDNNGWSVAHLLAEKGNLPKELMTDEILKLKDNDWWSVAHSLAVNLDLPAELMTDEIAYLETKNGLAVINTLSCGNFVEEELTEEILNLIYDSNTEIDSSGNAIEKKNMKNNNEQAKELIDISLSHQFSFTFQESLLKKSKKYMLINKDSSISLSLRKLIEEGRLLFNQNEVNDNNFPLFNKKVKEYLTARPCYERKNIQIFKSSFSEMETRLEDIDQEYFNSRNIILRHWLFYGLYKNNLIDI